MTEAQHAEYMIELVFIAGLLIIFLIALLLSYWLAKGRCDHHGHDTVRTVVIDRHVPAELPPRWDWRGRPADLAPPARSALPPPPPAVAPRHPVATPRHRELPT